MLKTQSLSGLMMAAGLMTHLGVALAQSDSPNSATAAEAASSAPAQAASAAAAKPQDANVEVQQVIVTAEKRVKLLEKTALSLSVVSGDDLKTQGITDAKGLTDTMSNVQIGGGTFGATDVSIRGIGSTDPSEEGDPEAAFHIDGIYLGRSQAAGATFFDLERVEVLRGPQGTLYGRNANAGAVNVITNKPSKNFEGRVDLTFGDYNTQVAEAMLNVPVSQSLAFRGVIARTKHDGYTDSAHEPENNFTRDRDDADDLSGRLMGLLRFSPDTTWLLSVDASSQRGAGPHAFAVVDDKIDHPDWKVDPVNQGSVRDSGLNETSEFKTSLGFADLTYLFGHRHSQRDEITSNGDITTIGVPAFHNTNNFDQNSNELRLSANNGALDWIAGLYNYREIGHDIDLTVFANLPFGVIPVTGFAQNPAVSATTAIFGQATYSLTPDLRATVGARYNRDEKSRHGKVLDGNGDPISPVGDDASATWNKATWKLGAEYDLAKTHMLYATLSTGFKAGGFNTGNSVVGDALYNPNVQYNPESITALELGSKSRHMDGRLQINVDVFGYDYTNLQLESVANGSLLTSNAGKARVYGAEGDGKFALSSADMLTFSAGLLHARFTRYTTPDGQNYRGKSLDKAPNATFTLGYTHYWALGSGAQITAHVDSRYSSSYVLSDPGAIDRTTGAPIPAKQVRQSSFWRSNATLGYNSVDDRWSLQAFVKNMENLRQFVGMTSDSGNNWVFLNDPRTYGIRATLTY